MMLKQHGGKGRLRDSAPLHILAFDLRPFR